MSADPDVVRRELLARILTDLDRCRHGRHRIDPCLSCPGGQSAGNPHLPAPGEIVGYDLSGQPYRMPAGDRFHGGSTSDPASWRGTDTHRGDTHG